MDPMLNGCASTVLGHRVPPQQGEGHIQSNSPLSPEQRTWKEDLECTHRPRNGQQGGPLPRATRPRPGGLAVQQEGARGWLGLAYQVRQLVQHFVDLLAVHKPDVGLPHEAPHLLPDVVLVDLEVR